MNTEDKRFQDALHNLTTAFYNFLDVVNPGGVDRAGDIRYIAQSLQNLATHMGGIPAAESTNQSDSIMETSAQRNQSSAPQPSISIPTSNSNGVSPYPDKPNFFRETPYYNKRTEKHVFDKLRPDDGPSKLFQFYINEDNTEGEFEMKRTSSNDWNDIYEAKEKVFPSQVVVVEGSVEMVPSCIESLEKGIVRRDANGRDWEIEKPCRVRITTA